MEARSRIRAALLLAGCAFAACGPGPTKQPVQEPSTSQSVQLARSMANAGRIKEALDALQEAIDREPDNAGLHNYYGVICFQAGRYGEAEESFRRALRIDPYLTDAHNYLGTVYMELDRPAEAEREFLQALDDPGYPTPEKVHVNLGLLYARQGRDEEAIRSFRRSVSIDPKYLKGHYHLAAMLERTGELLEAAREYEVAEPGYRANGEYWYRRGMTYYLIGDHAKALESLNRVRSVAPGSESAALADDLLEVLE
jgi:type IV pilus biogenesis/stability protein PilW